MEDKKHKQSGQTARVIAQVPEPTLKLNNALKPGLILYSLQGQPCLGLPPSTLRELEQQRPLKLVFRSKFSDLAKKTQAQLREEAQAQVQAQVVQSQSQSAGGLGPGAGGINIGAGGAMAQQKAMIMDLQEKLNRERELVSELRLDVQRQKDERDETVRRLHADMDLLDAGQKALLGQIVEIREEGRKSLERERKIRVQLEQVTVVNSELRQRLEGLANHYDEAKRIHMGEKQVLLHHLQVERDAHEMTKTELRSHEHELEKVLMELSVERNTRTATGSPVVAQSPRQLQPQARSTHQQHQQQHQHQQQQYQQHWAAQAPVGTDASATWTAPPASYASAAHEARLRSYAAATPVSSPATRSTYASGGAAGRGGGGRGEARAGATGQGGSKFMTL